MTVFEVTTIQIFVNFNRIRSGLWRIIKNYLFFTRRYLGNRKSYRDKWGGVSKRKVPRFRWSFIRWPEVAILGVKMTQNFRNFNKIRSGLWRIIKNYLFFTWRYLGNRKSYRDKWGGVSKRKVPRFRWSFIRWPEVAILGVKMTRNFRNFNRI